MTESVLAASRAKQTNAGTAGTAASDEATQPIARKAQNGRSGVRVAASVPRTAGLRDLNSRGIGPRAASMSATACEPRPILGTGPGNGASDGLVVLIDDRPSSATQSEIPRPSSRETAKPPRWVVAAAETVAAKPSAPGASQEVPGVEWAEAGPGRSRSPRIGPIAQPPAQRIAIRAWPVVFCRLVGGVTRVPQP